MTADGNLPIKVVPAREADYVAPGPAGGSTKVFGTVDTALRTRLADEVRTAVQHFSAAQPTAFPMPGVARVTLKREAVAKSHRPTELFNGDTCPIIGGNRLGELFVSVDAGGAGELTRRIERGASRQVEANISTLERIQPYDLGDALGGRTFEELLADVRRKQSLKVRLFHYATQEQNVRAESWFREVAARAGLTAVDPLDYAEGIRVFRVRGATPDRVAALRGFAGVGIQGLSVFPDLRLVRTASRPIGDITAADFPAPVPGREYPLVGVIDSGTDPDNPLLQAWVAHRHVLVPSDRQDNHHGSFVAGLIVHGRRLNHNDPRFPSTSSKVIDVVAIDRDGLIAEDELILVIDDCLRRFPQVQVWNLSLGHSTPCADTAFSEFGAALDDRAKRHGVLFVIAAGNYQTAPLRAWPPQDGIGDGDRICPPADATRALTVGSVAHTDTPNTCVRRDEPSPFSRRGPGPAYHMKPELSSFGGNCDAAGAYFQSGVVSLDPGGRRAENIGTSFATPLVSTLAANAEAELNCGRWPGDRTLLKASIIHAAFLRSAPIDSGRFKYVGVGCPPDIDEILSCRQSAATSVFRVPVRAGLNYQKRPFPMPPCLSAGGSLQCEVFMTLLYEPALNMSFGVEYCRCNVSASLGTIEACADGREKYDRQVDPAPKSLEGGFEEDLVKHGYKWSPLKLYYRKFSRGPAGKEWRLSMEMLTRPEPEPILQQDVVLLVTVRGKSPDLPVYDEMVRAMNRLGWGASDLEIRSRDRLRP